MNKKIKAFSLLISVIFIITSFSGCNININIVPDEFTFVNDKGEEKSVSPEDILNYTTSRPDAVGDYMRSKLSDAELYIYNAVSYAVDNGYKDLRLSGEYVDDDASKYVKAITFYSCDSPFLEHNYTTDGTFRLTESTSFGNAYYSFTLPRNSTAFTNEKQQAYEKAKELIKDIPTEYITDKQKAIHLYNYVTSNVNYTDAIDSYNYNTVPIYDALLTKDKETICDGFADTLMLLFNLADIECFAVEGMNNKNSGHVVVCAELDGQYYYFDPTNDSNARASGFKPGFYYAVSDKELASYFKKEADVAGILPVCPTSRISDMADVVAFSDDDNAVNNAKSVFLRDGSVNVYFTDTVSDSDKENFGRKLATAIGTTLINTKANGLVGYTK